MKTWFVVCRAGRDFRVEDANPQRLQFLKHAGEALKRGWRFVCLTDTPVSGCEWHSPLLTKAGTHPGWWSLMEIFRFRGPNVMTGLDTILTGDLDSIMQFAEDCPQDTIYGIRDFYYPQKWASGVTLWNGDWTDLFQECTPEARQGFRGDQDFIEWWVPNKMLGRKLGYLQDHITGLVSYKVHERTNSGKPLPPETKVCCFHGKPRPWEVAETRPWVKEALTLKSQEDQLPVCPVQPDESCILVGNGPSAVLDGKGEQVDSFDQVVRFNRFKVEGFESSVGSKTTLWATFGRDSTPLDNSRPDRAIFIHGHDGDPAWEMRELWRIPRSYFDQLMPGDERSIGPKGNKILPSSGFLVASWLLDQGVKKIHLLGFDHFDKTRSQQHHYWVPRAYRKPEEHNGEFEASTFKKWESEGRIVYIR